MRAADCHPERKHFCKGMCIACYSRSRYVPRQRPRRTNECGHSDRPHAGHGLCQSCFAIRKRENQGLSGQMKRKDQELMRRYGITLRMFHEMYEAQGRVCALCRREIERERDRHVDHCHETGQVRGILCFTCNKSLGMLGDNEEGLLRALAYVRAKRGVFVVDQWEGE